MLNIESYSNINTTEEKGYDCLECGHKTCVSATGDVGTCKTPGCLYNNPIQFVYYPNWQEPKVSRAGRTILFL